MHKRTLFCLLMIVFLIFFGSGMGYSQFSIDPPPSGDPNPYTLADARGFFWDLHVESEIYHNMTGAGDGTWENYYFRYGWPPYPPGLPPDIQCIASRVLSYIQAYRVDPQQIYRDRAIAGLTYLVNQQESDGRFERQDGQHGDSTVDEAFDTADAGEVLAEGYKEFGDPAYLNAAELAANWQLNGPLVDSWACDATCWSTVPRTPIDQLICFENANYVASIVRHLISVYEVTQHPDYLNAAINASQSIMQWQDASGDGTWPHYQGTDCHAVEKRMVYHELTLLGLLKTYRAIKGDPDHAAFQADLEVHINDAINYMVSQQDPISRRLYEDINNTANPCTGTTHPWVPGLRALSMAHRYLDLDATSRSNLERLLFALARNIPSYPYQGIYPSSSYTDTRLMDIRNYGEYLQSMASGPVYPGTEWSGVIRLTGDVIVPSGVTLTIQPGTEVLVAANQDDQQGGYDPDKIEIIVEGTLHAEGVTFRSSSGSPRVDTEDQKKTG